MTIAKRLEYPRILSASIATLLLAAGLPAQSRYFGELDGKHSVTRVYTRAGSCTIAKRVTPARQTITYEPGTFDISPPSNFSCQPHRFRDGHAVVNHPDVPVIVELSDPTAAPTVVNLSEPSNVTARITLMGRAQFRSGGDVHAVRIGVEVGLDPAGQARDQLTCSRQDAFVTDQEASRQINADAACSVSVMDVVGSSVKMAGVGGVMTVTEFDAEVESEFYIVMDHGSANDGNSIRKGARLTYRIKSRYKFQLAEDSIEVLTSTPDPEKTAALKPKTPQDFEFTVGYQLQTKPVAKIVAIALEQGGAGAELARSAEADAMALDGTVDLSIPGVPLPESEGVLIRIEMKDLDGNVLATEFVSYEYKPDYSIDHMEFVQTVQNGNNTVPLVARKPALVRVFVKVANTMDATKAGVPVILKGTRS